MNRRKALSVLAAGLCSDIKIAAAFDGCVVGALSGYEPRIHIERFERNDWATFGRVFVNGRFVCYSMELAWRNNAPFVSSIDDGCYRASLLYRGLNSSGQQNWRIQLSNEDTQPRIAVQIHIGNRVEDSAGCLLTGKKIYLNELRMQESRGALTDIVLTLISRGDLQSLVLPGNTILLNNQIHINISQRKDEKFQIASGALDARSYWLRNGIRWNFYRPDSSRNIKYDITEIRRTMKNIIGEMSTSSGGKSYFRIPVQGGHLQNYRGKEEGWGPWYGVVGDFL